jgi:hypothetical protein
MREGGYLCLNATIPLTRPALSLNLITIPALRCLPCTAAVGLCLFCRKFHEEGTILSEMPAFCQRILPSCRHQVAKNVHLPLRPPGQEGFAGTGPAGSILALASRVSRPFLRKLEANDLLQMPVSSGVLDLTVAFEIETGTVTNVKSAG